MSSSSFGASVDPSEEAVALYLVSKLLGSNPKLSKTYEALLEDIESNDLLGNTQDWTESVRPRRLEDFDRKFHRLPSDQLLGHLRNSMGGKSSSHRGSSSGSTSGAESLLLPMGGVLDFSNTKSRDSARRLAVKLVKALIDRRDCERDDAASRRRLAYLGESLERAKAGMGDETSATNKEREKEDKENYQDIDIMLTEEGGEDKSSPQGTTSGEDSSIRPVLREVGQEKEKEKVEKHLEEVQKRRQTVEEDIDKLEGMMRSMGGLADNLGRGAMDGRASWVRGRSLGLGALGLGRVSAQGIGRIGVPSSVRLQRNLSTNFKHVWTVSGHMHNPAYCCLFDRTGKFVISGADDYNLKIWDAERGLLVRTCRGHQGYITYIAVSPDNSLVASACTLGTIRLWELQTGKCVRCLRHGQGETTWMQFENRGTALCSSGGDGRCIVWDLSRLLAPEECQVPLLEAARQERHDKEKEKEEEEREKEKNKAASSASGRGSEGASEELKEGTADGEVVEVPVPALPGASDPGAEAGSQLGLEPAVNISPSAVPDRLEDSGLFEWSAGGGSDKLVLPHIQDLREEYQLDRGGDEEAIRVTCLDISPACGVLVTGCEDGVARVWAYSDKGNAGAAERTRSRALVSEGRLAQLRGVLEDGDLRDLEAVLKHLLIRLEGHSTGVTDVEFSHRGDRVATGSLNDGTVRIWSFVDGYSQSEHITLSLRENDAERSSDLSAGNMNNRLQRKTRGRDRTQAYNLAWTADDSRVLTLQNVLRSDATRLKVWDSVTGDLLRVIPAVSAKPCKVMAAHPTDPAFCATGGDDGTLRVWDLDREELLFAHTLKLPTAGHAAAAAAADIAQAQLSDLSFSPDGHHLVASDSCGCISLFGLTGAGPSCRALHYPEQYFSTDYAEIMVDAEGEAMDVGTQLPVHQAPVGALCSAGDGAYVNQPDLRRARHPEPLRGEEVERCLVRVAELSRGLGRAMNIRFNTTARHKRIQRPHRKYRSVRDKRIALPAVDAGGLSPPGKPHSRTSSGNVILLDHDLENYQPSSDEENDSDYDDRGGGFDDDDNDELTRIWAPVRRGQGSSSSSSSSNGSSSRRRARSRSRGRRGAARAARAFPVREVRNRHARPRNFVIESDESEAEMGVEGVENGGSGRAQRVERRSRQRRALLYGEHDDLLADTDEDVEESGSDLQLYDSDNEEQQRRRDLEKSRAEARRRRERNKGVLGSSHGGGGGGSRSRGGGPAPRGAGRWTRSVVPLDIGKTLDSTWLQRGEPSEHQYHPQVGDSVVYFPQGHIELLHLFSEEARHPWLSFPQRWPVVLCRVVGISYQFPTMTEHRISTSVVAVLTLIVTGWPNRPRIINNTYHADFLEPRSSRHSAGNEITFSVNMRACDGIPDFIIPEHRFQRSTKLQWYEGLRIRVPYQEAGPDGEPVFQMFGGRVHKLESSQAEWPHSLWESLVVQWDDQEASLGDAPPQFERIAPWEAQPELDPDSSFARSIASVQEPVVDRAIADTVTGDIEALLGSVGDRYTPFEFAVDPEAFPDYYCIVPCPMYVDLIKRRLCSGWYRQVEAIFADIELIYLNCIRYNEANAEINLLARELADKLLLLVRTAAGLPATAPAPAPAQVLASSSTLARGGISVGGGEASSSQAARASKRSRWEQQGEEEEEDDDEGGEREAHPAKFRRSSRRGLSVRERVGEGAEELPGRGIRNPAVPEVDDEEEYHEEEEEDDDDNDDDEDDEFGHSMRRRGRRGSSRSTRTRGGGGDRVPARPLRSTRSQQSYSLDSDDDEALFEEEGEVAGSSSSRSRRSRGAGVARGATAAASRAKVRGWADQVYSRPLNDIAILEGREATRLGPEEKRAQQSLMKAAEEADEEYLLFAEPVSEAEVPGYTSVVVRPMDFGTVRSRMERRLYRTLAELANDIFLCYDNCEHFNSDDSIFHVEAQRQRQAIQSAFDDLLLGV